MNDFRNTSRIVQTQPGPSHCLHEQEALRSLLSTGWLQEKFRKCFYKLTAFYMLELK